MSTKVIIIAYDGYYHLSLAYKGEIISTTNVEAKSVIFISALVNYFLN